MFGIGKASDGLGECNLSVGGIEVVVCLLYIEVEAFMLA